MQGDGDGKCVVVLCEAACVETGASVASHEHAAENHRQCCGCSGSADFHSPHHPLHLFHHRLAALQGQVQRN